MDTAIDLDACAWKRFAAVEARRIMTTFDIPAGGGLLALERALGLRLYAVVNSQHTEWFDDYKRLRFFMDVCRVPEARLRKGLPGFPCKHVGIVEFETFAATIDPRIRTTCLRCPPDAPVANIADGSLPLSNDSCGTSRLTLWISRSFRPKDVTQTDPVASHILRHD